MSSTSRHRLTTALAAQARSASAEDAGDEREHRSHVDREPLGTALTSDVLLTLLPGQGAADELLAVLGVGSADEVGKVCCGGCGDGCLAGAPVEASRTGVTSCRASPTALAGEPSREVRARVWVFQRWRRTVTSSRSAVSHADIETSALTGPAIFSRVLASPSDGDAEQLPFSGDTS